MSKRALCFVLNLFLTASLLFGALPEAFAEETGTAPASTSSGSPELSNDIVSTLPSGASVSDPLKGVSPQLSKSAVPVLTVNAISNYFGKAYAEYNEYTKEVRVSYLLKASKRLMTADWTLTYDSSVLRVDPKKNPVEAICPIINRDALVDFDEDGVISLYATSLNLFDFSTHEAVFAQIVFDVKDISIEEPEITKVDLTVNNLWVSEPNPADGKAMPGREIVLVSHGEVIENDKTDSVLVSKVTSLTNSTFNEQDHTRSTPDQAVTVASTAPKPSAPPKPKPVVTPQRQETAKNDPAIWVQTGRWYVAALILTVLFACSIILFVMRKRDIYDD